MKKQPLETPSQEQSSVVLQTPMQEEPLSFLRSLKFYIIESITSTTTTFSRTFPIIDRSIIIAYRPTSTPVRIPIPPAIKRQF